MFEGDPWTVSTVTGSEVGQGTVSAVAIVMYGDKGRSDPILIGEDKNFQFKEGKTDEFEVNVFIHLKYEKSGNLCIFTIPKKYEYQILFQTKVILVICLFQVRVVADVGTLYKVRVGFHSDDHKTSWYEDSSQAPSWFLEKVS